MVSSGHRGNPNIHSHAGHGAESVRSLEARLRHLNDSVLITFKNKDKLNPSNAILFEPNFIAHSYILKPSELKYNKDYIIPLTKSKDFDIFLTYLKYAIAENNQAVVNEALTNILLSLLLFDYKELRDLGVLIYLSRPDLPNIANQDLYTLLLYKLKPDLKSFHKIILQNNSEINDIYNHINLLMDMAEKDLLGQLNYRTYLPLYVYPLIDPQVKRSYVYFYLLKLLNKKPDKWTLQDFDMFLKLLIYQYDLFDNRVASKRFAFILKITRDEKFFIETLVSPKFKTIFYSALSKSDNAFETIDILSDKRAEIEDSPLFTEFWNKLKNYDYDGIIYKPPKDRSKTSYGFFILPRYKKSYNYFYKSAIPLSYWLKLYYESPQTTQKIFKSDYMKLHFIMANLLYDSPFPLIPLPGVKKQERYFGEYVRFYAFYYNLIKSLFTKVLKDLGLSNEFSKYWNLFLPEKYHKEYKKYIDKATEKEGQKLVSELLEVLKYTIDPSPYGYNELFKEFVSFKFSEAISKSNAMDLLTFNKTSFPVREAIANNRFDYLSKEDLWEYFKGAVRLTALAEKKYMLFSYHIRDRFNKKWSQILNGLPEITDSAMPLTDKERELILNRIEKLHESWQKHESTMQKEYIEYLLKNKNKISDIEILYFFELMDDLSSKERDDKHTVMKTAFKLYSHSPKFVLVNKRPED